MIPHFRNVARSICRVAFTNGVGSGGVMLTMRFAIDAARHDGTVEALRRRILPPAVYRKGVAGVHLCLADEAVSNIVTAERRARTDDATAVPSWVLLIEGISQADVNGAADDIAPTLAAHEARNVERAVYRLEHTRLKTPWAAGIDLARCADRVRRRGARGARGVRRHHGDARACRRSTISGRCLRTIPRTSRACGAR